MGADNKTTRHETGRLDVLLSLMSCCLDVLTSLAVLMSSEHLEGVTLLCEPLEALGQSGVKLVDGFQGIVEGDDGAVADVALDVVDDVVGRHPLGVVAGDDVPHHDLVAAREPGILGQAHPSVRRTEEMAADVGVGFLDIEHIVAHGVAEAADVVVGVIAHEVALVDDLLEEIGILAHVVAYDEEGGTHAETTEDVENKRCGLGDGTVVERQIDCALTTVHSPEGFRVEPAEVDGWLLDNHVLYPVHGVEADSPALQLLTALLQVVEELLGFLLVDAVVCLYDAVHLS